MYALEQAVRSTLWSLDFGDGIFYEFLLINFF